MSWVYKRRNPIYAIIRSGGRQYRVEVGTKIEVDRLTAAEGERIELPDVLFVVDGDRMTVGRPTVDGAKVTAEVVGHGRSRKVIAFKYKAKVRYRKRVGHRQWYTTLSIADIVAPGTTAAPPKRSRRKAKTEDEGEAEAEAKA
ncbi:MAG: 50S ribosomal protein L21 [Dehalococcoidia bacterium]